MQEGNSTGIDKKLEKVKVFAQREFLLLFLG